MSYQLPTGAADSKRLEFQSQTLEKLTRSHIMQTGLFDKTDKLDKIVVADIGCGIGSVTIDFLNLNNLEGIEGRIDTIYAFDNSSDALTETQKNVEQWFNNNKDKVHAKVEYILIDIREKIDLLFENLADLIFMRFVLNNISISTHNTAILNMKKILKPNGQIVCEESVWNNIMCSHQSSVVEEYKSTLLSERIKLGIDLNVGKYLDSLFTEAGLSIKSYEIIDRNITPQQLITMYNSLMTINYNKLNEDLTKTEEEKEEIRKMYQRWDNAFNTIPKDDPSVHVQTSGTGCIIATK